MIVGTLSRKRRWSHISDDLFRFEDPQETTYDPPELWETWIARCYCEMLLPETVDGQFVKAHIAPGDVLVVKYTSKTTNPIYILAELRTKTREQPMKILAVKEGIADNFRRFA